MAAISLPITLVSAGAAALINTWLAIRVGRARGTAKVSIGDGGDMALIARMRAHSNFVEYTPFVLILIGLIELNIGSALWLWGVAAVYLLGRVAHGLGMDGLPRGRQIGTLSTLVIMVGLGIYAAIFPLLPGNAAPHILAPTEAAPAKG
ncbi:MAG: MAPEG family protein [Sphingomonas sp.]